MENAKYIVSTEYDGKPRRLYEKTCVVCSTLFYTPKHRLHKQTTCSVKCSIETRKTQVQVECYVCKKELWRRPCKLNNKSGLQFCSRTCKEFAQSLRGGCKQVQPSHYGTGNGISRYRNATLTPESKCACGVTHKFLLVVHHRDGDRNNNDPTNLEVTCFNCHAMRHLKKDSDGEWKISYASLTSEEDLRALGIIRNTQPLHG